MKTNKPRKPTLADRLIALHPNDSVMEATWLSRAQDRLRLSKRFMLDPQGTTYLGEMIRESPRIIADAQDFALRPFDHMWIELPFKHLYRAVTGRDDDHYSDLMVGYLFNGPTVNVAAMAGEEDFSHMYAASTKVDFMPMQYTLHRPMPLDEQLKFCDMMGTSRLNLDLWFWGESALKFMPDDYQNKMRELYRRSPALAALKATNEADRFWDAAGMRSLRANHSVELAPLRNPKNLDHKDWTTVRESSAGDLRNIIALLIYLNRTADIRYEEPQPMQQRVYLRKPRPLLPYSVIRIRLDPRSRLRTLSAGTGVMRRLHDVRGHFCHDRKARAGCMHGIEREKDFGEWWEEYEPLQWRCTGCGGKRWWRHEHKRGTHKVGVVLQQEYEVTK